METFIVYLIKATICLTLFSVFFRLFLMRETFFQFIRITLLMSLIVFSILPFAKLKIDGSSIVNQSFTNLENIILSRNISETINFPVKETELSLNSRNDNLNPKNATEQLVKINNYEKSNYNRPLHIISTEKSSFAINWVILLLSIYWIGLVLMIMRLIVSLIRIKQLVKNSILVHSKDFRLVVTPENIVAFSFFRYIVLSENDYHDNPEEIILHEKMHIQKRHNIDVIFTELLLALHWFNPMVWMLCRDLREIHEYEADNGVINKGIEAQRYQLLLVKKAVGERRFISVVNSFNQSKIKNRITMMLKKESSVWARLKVLFIVPLAAVMLLAFAQPESEMKTQLVKSQSQPESVVKQVQVNPFFYWEQVQNYCRDKGILPKDLALQPGDEKAKQYIIILVNSVNQIMYENPVSSKVIKTQEEGNSASSIEILKSMIVESMNMNDPNPVYFLFQHDQQSSMHFIFSLLNSTLPSAYQAAVNEIAERKGFPITQMLKKNPLILVHAIPKNFSGNANSDKEKRVGKRNSFLIQTSEMKEGRENMDYYSIVRENEGPNIQSVSVRREISLYESGDEARVESVSASELKPSDFALVSVGTDLTASDLNGVKTMLDKKFKVGKSVFVQNIQ